MKNIREFHDKLNTVFHLTLALPLLPMTFLYLEINHRARQPTMAGDTLVYLACFTAAVLILGYAYATYRRRVMEIRALESTGDKFRAIFPAYRNYYAGNLVAALLLTLGYYLTGAGLLIGSYLFLLFSLSFLRPHADRYIRDLQLGEEESKAARKKELSFQ